MKKMSKKGFTLIELVVVMAIIAILALMVLGAVIAARNMSLETKHRNNGKALQVGMEKYYASNKKYPTLSAVTFTSAATTLNVTLDSTSECTGTALGGGMVASSTDTTFAIQPYDSTCTNRLGTEEYKQPN